MFFLLPLNAEVYGYPEKEDCRKQKIVFIVL
jgi:hypothetical protein